MPNPLVVKAGMMQPIAVVLANLQHQPMNGKTTYQLLRLHRKLMAEHRTYDEAKNALLKKYAEPMSAEEQAEQTEPVVPGQVLYKIKEEHAEIFNAQIQQISNEDIILAGLKPLPISVLENLKLSMNQMMVLAPILDGPLFDDENSGQETPNNSENADTGA